MKIKLSFDSNQQKTSKLKHSILYFTEQRYAAVVEWLPVKQTQLCEQTIVDRQQKSMAIPALTPCRTVVAQPGKLVPQHPSHQLSAALVHEIQHSLISCAIILALFSSLVTQAALSSLGRLSCLLFCLVYCTKSKPTQVVSQIATNLKRRCDYGKGWKHCRRNC